jgi:hypothetical protein
MNYYLELPNDFRIYWFQNFIFEIFNYGKLTKFFDKPKHHIRIYEYKTCNGKHTKIHTLNYNTMISSYEINTTRFANYRDAFNALWDLQQNPPL